MQKVILISGASRGIGNTLAKKFLNMGFYVIGTSRTGEIKDIDSPYFEALALDVASLKSIEEFEKKIKAKNRKIDILINNAGVAFDSGHTTPDANSFDATFETNVKGVVFLTEALIPHLAENAQITSISSKMGSIELTSTPDSIAYRMSKAALNMYTKLLANRLEGKHNVSSIHPGWVRTTISAHNTQAPYSAEESAKLIYDFLSKNNKNGIFWNIETQDKCAW